jgi:hypothetical protein
VKIEQMTMQKTTSRRTLRLTREDMLQALRLLGVEISEDASVTIRMHVPGGGDWSNTDLDVDDENPIEVTILEVQESRRVKLQAAATCATCGRVIASQEEALWEQDKVGKGTHFRCLKCS